MSLGFIASLFLTLAVVSIPKAAGHECFVCRNQTGNNGKCSQTVSICPYPQDACMTQIRWGSQPGWRLGVPMIDFVSKTCSTYEQCLKQQARDMPFCTYVDYEDWRCTNCCRGDRCNYYIIDSATTSRLSLLVLLVWAAITLH